MRLARQDSRPEDAAMKPRCRLLLALTLCLGAALPAMAAPGNDDDPNSLTEEEKKAGFKLLFDGKTTAGWRGFRKKEMPSGWQVIDGALARVGPGGDIVTVDQFKNFELLLQWKVAPGANSGIMYHVSEDERAPYLTGPEYQILDNARHADGKSPLTSAASCYALYAPTKDATRPVGEWNDAKILVKGRHVEHWLNGEKVVEYEKGGAEWNDKVAKSKFNSMKNFGKTTEGHIDLQDHGDQVWYRAIKIRVLPDE
jgi:hypothetical protein